MRCVIRLSVICLILVCLNSAFGAPVILNEYNAVANDQFLGGGDELADLDGGKAGDIYFGRILGNGGNWFELVVITDHLDMRSWKLDIFENGSQVKTLKLTDYSIWSDLRSGTIITVSENVPSDISYNPPAGDWWINVQASNGADGRYIEASNFPVSNDNWQLRIRNAASTIVVDKTGEGVSPPSGISGTEIFKLKADPNASITPNSPDYKDDDKLSTFGAPNRWGAQDFTQLRSVIVETGTISLLYPNGLETLKGGTIATILWTSQGTISSVLVEFSLDDGLTWQQVFPPNVGNTGSYNWLVPMVDSAKCLVRVSSRANPAVWDSSELLFKIYRCTINGDLSGDCAVNLVDLAILASYWLECANPYDPTCN
ncbi:MAG: hypothetical protein NTX52_08310 [Planctomycetota bacterium]|nr:hypothetical protein [Planctomycetota bacterium]